jgi:hypothetical protein
MVEQLAVNTRYGILTYVCQTKENTPTVPNI